MKNTKDVTEVKVGDVIRIVKSKNENMHHFPNFTLCKVVEFSPEDEYDFSYEVISLYMMNIFGKDRYLTQYIRREDFEVVL